MTNERQSNDPRNISVRHNTDKTQERPVEESSERLNKDVTDPTVGPIGERGIVAPKSEA